MSSRLGAILMVSAATVLLGGCAVKPEPLTDLQHASRAAADVATLFDRQEPVTKPVSLHEAMARAIKYNLDHRLKVMESALMERQLTVANLDMLPTLAANAGYEGRNSQLGSSSRSLLTGLQSLETSTSTDRERVVGDFGLQWNVLDFGMSYVRALQQADRGLIVEERRRKVIHNIIQDVRSAYWYAVSAERLLARLDGLQERTVSALANARVIEERGLQPPLEALTYRRDLIEMQRQVKELRRNLVASKTQLASLMGLRPGQKFELSVDEDAFREPEVNLTLAEIERSALMMRPELREEAYQTRIGELDVKRAMLSLLPGLSLDGGYNFDSNSYTQNNHWWEWGAQVNLNLLRSFIAGPARIAEAEMAEEVANTRRLALSMAVLSQAHISWLAYLQSVSEFRTAAELNAVEASILKQMSAAKASGRQGDMQLMQGELNALISELRRDIAFAEMSNAVGRLYVTAGTDPLPQTVAAHDIGSLTKALADNDKAGGTMPGAVEPLPVSTAPAELFQLSKLQVGWMDEE